MLPAAIARSPSTPGRRRIDPAAGAEGRSAAERLVLVMGSRSATFEWRSEAGAERTSDPEASARRLLSPVDGARGGLPRVPARECGQEVPVHAVLRATSAARTTQ